MAPAEILTRRTCLFAGLVVLGAILAAAWQAVTSERIASAGGCGFDGEQYCLMAEGKQPPFQVPYARRVLVPSIVRALHVGGVLDRFLLVDVLAVFASAVLAYVLTRRLHPALTAAPAVTVAGLTVLNPWTWHIAMTAPALTDQVALALGLAWMIAILSPAAWTSGLFAALAVLAREAWAPAMGLGIVYAAVARRISPLVAGSCLTLLGLATAYGMTRPDAAYGTGMGASATVKYWLSQNFLHLDGFGRFASMVLAGLGLVCVAGFLVWRSALLTVERRLVLLVAAALAALAVVGGGDTDRLLLVPFVFIAAVVVPLLFSERGLTATALLVVGTVALWRPWVTPSGMTRPWLDYFAVRAMGHEALVHRLIFEAVVVLVVAVGVVVSVRRGQPPMGGEPVAALRYLTPPSRSSGEPEARSC